MRIAVALLLAALGSLPAQRPAPKTAAKLSPVAQQLLRNEDGWAAALVKRDAAYFRRMLAPGSSKAVRRARGSCIATGSPTRGSRATTGNGKSSPRRIT